MKRWLAWSAALLTTAPVVGAGVRAPGLPPKIWACGCPLTVVFPAAALVTLAAELPDANFQRFAQSILEGRNAGALLWRAFFSGGARINIQTWLPEKREHLQTPALYPEEFEARLAGFFNQALK